MEKFGMTQDNQDMMRFMLMPSYTHESKTNTPRMLIGVTGTMGSGKSYISEKLVDYAKGYGISAQHLDLDNVGHKVLDGYEGEMYDSFRKELIDEFGDIADKQGRIIRPKLSKMVFSSKEKMQKLNDLIKSPLEKSIWNETKDLYGLVFVEGALLVDEDFTHVVDNNVLLIYADEQSQKARIRKRGHDRTTIDDMLSMQLDFSEKKEKMRSILKREGHGKYWLLDNSRGANIRNQNSVFNNIVNDYDFILKNN